MMLVKPSVILTALLSFMYIGAACLMLLLSINYGLIFALLIILAVNANFTIKKLLNSPIKGLKYSDGNYTLYLKNGKQLITELEPGTMSHPWLIVLNLKESIANTSHLLWLLPDSLSRDDHRRLRVRLRYG